MSVTSEMDVARHVFVACADRGSGAGISACLASRGWAVSTCTVAEATTDPEQILARATAERGPIRAVIANHLGYDLVPGAEAPAGFQWKDDLAALSRLADACLPMLSNAGGGTLVVITFTSHFAEPADLVELAASKGAIIGAVRALAVREGPSVRVVSVSPGLVMTPKITGALAAMDTSARARITAQAVERTPLRRLGHPSDVGAICAWLISERASFVTGVDIVVDGGAVALNRTFSYNPPSAGQKVVS